MADRVGQQLGNYRLIKLLGRGGFADVYLGQHLFLKTRAAIKVLHTKLTNDELEGFLTEARILSRLEHPHIVCVLDFDVEDDSPFLVMEYAPNGTLRQRHPKNTLVPLDTIVFYIKQVASALQYAHDAKLIHRDVKPENMLVGKHNEVLLSDFGFVTISQSSRAENVQDIAGTIAYMAPEQIQAHPSRASDQYALGIVVYEWLIGRRPFNGTLEEITAKHMSISPPSLCERIPTLSPRVEVVVMKALEKDPSQRFASVQEFAEAFEQACMIGPEAAKSRQSLRQNIPSKAKIVKPEITEPDILKTVSVPQPNVAVNNEVHANKSFSFKSYSVNALALSPDGKRVAFGGWDEKVYVYDIAEEGKIFTYNGHTDLVGNLAWSPDGKYVASTSNDRTVQVWDATTGGNIFTFHGHSDSVHAIAWSPDSMRIASGGYDSAVQVWDATTGNNVCTYRGHAHSVGVLTWSHDGQRIASGSSDVQVWDVNSGSIVCTYRGHLGWVHAVAWSPDDTSIASAGDSESAVQIWNATTRRHIFTIRLYNRTKGIAAIGWSVDGKRIRVGLADGSIQERDATTGNNVFTYPTQYPYEGFVSALTWTPDGTRIAIGGDDRRVLVCDEDNTFVCRAPAAPVEVLGTSSSVSDYYAVKSITWSPDNTRIASANRDDTVQVWDAATGSHVFTWRVNSPLTAVAWSPDTIRIASGFRDGLVRVWDSTTGNITCTYRGHTADVEGVAWSPDGRRIASASWDKTVQIWDTTSGDTIFTCSSNITNFFSDAVAWSPDGKRLVSGGSDGLVQVWDANTGNLIHTCRGHSDRVKTVAWSPDGTYFASGSNDKTVQVWDATTGKSVFIYRGHTDEVVDVAWSPDSKYIYSSSKDNTIQIWDATTGSNVFVHRSHLGYLKKVTAVAWKTDGTCFAIGNEDGKLLICDAVNDNIIVCSIPSEPAEIVLTNDEQRRISSMRQGVPTSTWDYGNAVIYDGHSSMVRSLAWSPDSGRIASGGHDNTVHVWDATTRTLIFTYCEHLDPVVTVAWSPDGQYIASGSLDNTVHIWDVVTGRTMLTYRGHSNSVWSLAWSPDGKHIASASEDETVQIWDISTGKAIFTYHGHSAPIETVGWSPDGKYIASGGDDATVRIWDACTGNDIYRYRNHKSNVSEVAWSPDGRRIASGGFDMLGLSRIDGGSVHIWDAPTGNNVITCGWWNPYQIESVTWSPDGRHIASNGTLTVLVWDVATGDPVIACGYHDNDEVFVVWLVRWSPDGTRIAFSTRDGRVLVGPVNLAGVPT